VEAASSDRRLRGFAAGCRLDALNRIIRRRANTAAESLYVSQCAPLSHVMAGKYV